MKKVRIAYILFAIVAFLVFIIVLTFTNRSMELTLNTLISIPLLLIVPILIMESLNYSIKNIYFQIRERIDGRILTGIKVFIAIIIPLTAAIIYTLNVREKVTPVYNCIYPTFIGMNTDCVTYKEFENTLIFSIFYIIFTTIIFFIARRWKKTGEETYLILGTVLFILGLSIALVHVDINQNIAVIKWNSLVVWPTLVGGHYILIGSLLRKERISNLGLKVFNDNPIFEK